MECTPDIIMLDNDSGDDDPVENLTRISRVNIDHNLLATLDKTGEQLDENSASLSSLRLNGIASSSDHDDASQTSSSIPPQADHGGERADFAVKDEIIEALMEDILAYVCEDDDQDEANYPSSTFETITCEVQLDLGDSAYDDGNTFTCAYCSEEMEQVYELIDDSIIVCSESCAENVRKSNGRLCSICRNLIDSKSLAYLPRFGNVTIPLCSDQCLMRYEAEQKPLVNCKQCCVQIKRDKNQTFHWQTYDFCSGRCILACLISYQLCSFCSGYCPLPARGKYAVRFGSTVRNFCSAACLDKFKKRSKSCTFCQKQLTAEKVNGGFFPVRGRAVAAPREFCNADCLSNYRDVVANQNARKLPQTEQFCDICSCFIANAFSDGIRLLRSGEEKMLCSSACVAAFRYSHNVAVCFCDNCGHSNITSGKVNMLTAQGKLKVFCTNRCITLYVLKKREITPCSVCKVKKYSFDLVEEFLKDREEVNTYCSVGCLQTRLPAHQKAGLGLDQNARSGHAASSQAAGGAAATNGRRKLVLCGTCKKYREPTFHLKANNQVLHSFCSQQCVSDFKQQLSAGNPTVQLQPNSTPRLVMSNNSNSPSLQNNSAQIALRQPNTNLPNILPKPASNLVQQARPLSLHGQLATNIKPQSAVQRSNQVDPDTPYNLRRRDSQPKFNVDDEEESDPDDYLDERGSTLSMHPKHKTPAATNNSAQPQPTSTMASNSRTYSMLNPNLGGNIRTYSNISNVNAQQQQSATLDPSIPLLAFIPQSSASFTTMSPTFTIANASSNKTVEIPKANGVASEQSASSLIQSLAAKAADSGTAPKTGNVTVMIKERPAVETSNAGVQARASYVTRAIMARPAVADASSQTD